MKDKRKIVLSLFLISIIIGFYISARVFSTTYPMLIFHENLEIGDKFDWEISDIDVDIDLLHEGDILTIEINKNLTDNFYLDTSDLYDIFTDYYGDVFIYYLNNFTMSASSIVLLYQTIRLEMNFFYPKEYVTSSQTYDYFNLRCDYLNSVEGSYLFFNDTFEGTYFESETFSTASIKDGFFNVNVTSYGLREWIDGNSHVANESWIVCTNESISLETGLLHEYSLKFTQTNFNYNQDSEAYDITSFDDMLVLKFLRQHLVETTIIDAEGKEAVTFMGQTFINDGRAGRAHQLAIALLNGQLSFPTVVFLTLENNKISVTPVPGYRPPKDMEPLLSYFADKAYNTTSWEDYQKNFVGKVR